MKKYDLDGYITGKNRMIINRGGAVYLWLACEILCSSAILSSRGYVKV